MAPSPRIVPLPGPAGERALVSRLRAGEDQAYRDCYELHAPRTLALLARMLRDRAKAEENLQETFVAAFDKIDDTTPIPGGTQRGEMFVKTFTDTTLDVGETQPPLHLDLHCGDQGDAEIRARIFADIDQSALFPRSLSPNGEQTVKVV